MRGVGKAGMKHLLGFDARHQSVRHHMFLLHVLSRSPVVRNFLDYE